MNISRAREFPAKENDLSADISGNSQQLAMPEESKLQS